MSDPVVKPRPEPAEPAKPVFVDYLGEPDLEGHRRPGHRIAPVVAGSESGKLPRIVIRPGLTVQDPTKWVAHCPGAKKGVKPSVIRALVEGGHLVVLEALPTDAAELIELATRTQCPDAMQILLDHEIGRKGGGKDKKPSRARAPVLAALKARKATVDRRVKSQVAPGDQRRLEAVKAKSRVLH